MSSQSQLKKARNTLFSYYRKESKDQSTSETNSSSNINVLIPDEPPSSEPQIIESTQVDISSLERDPGLRLPIWSYPINERDNVRRAYIIMSRLDYVYFSFYLIKFSRTVKIYLLDIPTTLK